MEQKQTHIFWVLWYMTEMALKTNGKWMDYSKCFFDNWLFPLIPKSHCNKISIPKFRKRWRRL